MLTSKCPYPPHEGMTIRTYNLIKFMSNYHEIYLLTLIQNKEEISGLEQMKKYCKLVYGAPIRANNSRFLLTWYLFKSLFSGRPFISYKYDVKEVRLKIRELVNKEKFDIAHLDLLHLVQYENEIRGIPKILIEHNVESILLSRRVKRENNLIIKAFLYTQYLKLRKYEKIMCERMEHCIVVSEVDRETLASMIPGLKVTVIPNGTDTDYFVNNETIEKHLIVFVGNLTWFPNIDGIRYFIKRIFPIVLNAIPDIKFYIVGKNSPKYRIPRRYESYIHQTGVVSDIRPFVSRASVYIVPLRIGGGTRLKVLDAMAMKKAIVSTSVGCEGIEVMPGRDIVIEDNPVGFANHVVNLIKNPNLAGSLGENARNLVEKRYNWDIIYRKMHNIYSNFVRG